MKNIRNAIVCMFDSWQFNYAGCYGNEWIKTPNFDRFAREGVLFENAYGNNMPTLPVRRSLMTGRFTIQEIGWGPLRPEDTTIADLCWGTGVATALVYNTQVMYMGKAGYNRSYATAIFTQGYDEYYYSKDELYDHYTVDQFFEDPGFLDRLRATPDGRFAEKTSREVMDLYLRDKQHWKKEEDHTVVKNIRAAIKVIKERDKNHGFHLWIDNWDPHEPWDPPSVWDKDMECPYDKGYKGCDIWQPPMGLVEGIYTEEQLHHIRMLFAEKITLCDKYFGELCDCIRNEGMWENTLMWVTSDHGEPMGNGEWGHGLMCKVRPWPYEELVHIPLLIKFPGCKVGMRTKAYAQDCDCAPTVLDWLGLPIPRIMTGKSLLPLCRGEVEKVRDFAVTGYFSFSWSIITDDYSFIHWLATDTKGSDENMSIWAEMYTSHAAATQEIGRAVSDSVDDDTDYKAMEEYKKQRSLDGEAQWTCNPNTRTDVPEGDELYDRRNDPFQLNNIISEKPEVAAELLKTLRTFMTDMRLA